MIGDNIKYLRKMAGYSQEQLARKLNITQGAISLWEKGKAMPDTKYLPDLMSIFGVSMDDLFSDEPRRELDSIRVIRNAVPILGTIGCGSLKEPDTIPDGYADLPDGVRADFALKCEGDSMEPTFIDGDLVLIRQQPEVENGQIAAVNVEGETTLKHVYHQQGGVLLVADNPAYSPMFFSDGKDVIIHGLAVGYTRLFER